MVSVDVKHHVDFRMKGMELTSREKRVCNIDLVEEREEISCLVRGADVIGEKDGDLVG